MDHPLYKIFTQIIPSPAASTLVKVIVTIGAKVFCYIILTKVYKCIKPCLPWAAETEYPEPSSMTNSKNPTSEDMESWAKKFTPSKTSNLPSFDDTQNCTNGDDIIPENLNTDAPMDDDDFQSATQMLLASINARRSRRAVVIPPTKS